MQVSKSQQAENPRKCLGFSCRGQWKQTTLNRTLSLMQDKELPPLFLLCKMPLFLHIYKMKVGIFYYIITITLLG